MTIVGMARPRSITFADITPRSRGSIRPRFAEKFRALKSEGAGNAGCALHPRSRVQKCAKNAHEHTGSAEDIRHSLRNGLTAYNALSPEYRAFLPPSPSGYGTSAPGRADMPPKDLTPTTEASGPHDFAVRNNIVRQRAV